MKKKLVLLLSVVLVIGTLFVGCAGNTLESSRDPRDTKATVVDTDGQTVEISSKELIALREENSAKFSDKYWATQATINGTVEKVDSQWETWGSTTESVYVIYLEEGWVVTVLEEEHPEVIDFSKGDKVEITSTIQGGHWSGRVPMAKIGNYGDGTEIVVK